MRKRNTKRLVFSALMVAMSIIIGIVCKTYFTISPILRVTFDNMPVILLGMLFGPVYSTMAAVGADLISALIAGYAPTPLITVGAAVLGAVAGLIPRYIIKRKGFLAILISSLAAHSLGSILIKSYALSELYSLDFLPTLWARLPVCLGISVIEAYLVYIIMKNKRISSLSEGKGVRR